MKKVSRFAYSKMDCFDGIELFEAQHDVDFFPFHKHDTFCISIITSGTEIFENRQTKLIIPENTVSITQANEVHKNYALSELGYSYKTIYVNSDLLAYFNQGERIDNLEAIINDPSLFQRIYNIFEMPNNNKGFEDMLKHLCRYKQALPQAHKNRFSTEALDQLIEKDFSKTIDVDVMADHFHTSKYHFIRTFKKQTGITPQVYSTLFKLKRAKHAIQQGKVAIKDATYDFGFYDISHFSNTFKKFYGVTPTQYQNALQSSNSIQLITEPLL